jgi:hypothetical protein
MFLRPMGRMTCLISSGGSKTIEFENTLQERAQELELKLKDCNDLRESDILINEIDTIESVLGRLSDLKYGEKVRTMEIA